MNYSNQYEPYTIAENGAGLYNDVNIALLNAIPVNGTEN